MEILRSPSRGNFDMHMNTNSRRSIITAVVFLVLSIGACVAAGYFAWIIQGNSAVRAQLISNAESKAAKQVSALRIQSLANNTEADRARLISIARADPLALADLIEEMGRVTGVSMTLSDVRGENPTGQMVSLGVRPVSFVVKGEGSFDGLMHAYQLLGSLPAPSVIHKFELVHAQQESVPIDPKIASRKSAQPLWRLTAYLRVFTALDSSL